MTVCLLYKSRSRTRSVHRHDFHGTPARFPNLQKILDGAATAFATSKIATATATTIATATAPTTTAATATSVETLTISTEQQKMQLQQLQQYQ